MTVILVTSWCRWLKRGDKNGDFSDQINMSPIETVFNIRHRYRCGRNYININVFSFSFSICTLFECTGQKMRSFCDFDQPFLWDDGFLSTPRFGFQRFYGKNKNVTVQKWRRNASDKNWRRFFSENGEKTTESGLESCPTFKFCLILVQSLLNTSA